MGHAGSVKHGAVPSSVAAGCGPRRAAKGNLEWHVMCWSFGLEAQSPSVAAFTAAGS